MNTLTAHLPNRPPGRGAHRAPPQCLEPAPAGPHRYAIRPALAGHDFLVPNPRPDLVLDPNTLRMLEAG